MMHAGAMAGPLDAGERALRALQEQYGAQVMDELREPLRGVLPPDSTLLVMSDYVLATGGKRLRAFLPLLTAQRLGEAPELLVPFGAACEILHNATLVHDDVQDGDRVRRGQATVWERFGMAQAINFGDALFYQAVLLCQRLSFAAPQREAVVRRLLLATLGTIDGQEREFQLKQSEQVSLAHYFKMVECKTSGLFALPMAGAAELCAAPAALVAGLEEAARHLGVLFQVQDDLLDVFGDKGRGQAARDLAEGKRSFLVVSALQAATAEDAQQLRRLLSAGTASEEDVAWAKELFLQTGAASQACAELLRRRELALAVPQLKASPPLRELVEELFQVFVSPIRHVMSAMESIA